MSSSFPSNVTKGTPNIYNKNIGFNSWKDLKRGKPIFVIPTDFSFFWSCKLLNTSFLLESLMMTLFGLVFVLASWWQASILPGSTGVTQSLKSFKTQFFNSSSWIVSAIFEISRYAWRQYCLFTEHSFSNKLLNSTAGWVFHWCCNK